MRDVFLAIVALCAIGAFAGWIVLRDNDHWRNSDPRHASSGAFRGALIALAGCCVVIGALICSAFSAYARPSPFPPVTQFNGDKYDARQTQLGPEVAKSAKAKQGAKARRAAPTRRHPVPRARSRPGIRQIPIWAPLAERAVEPLSVAQGAWREAKRAVGRPRAWCGWWLGQHLGMHDRSLWLARNWASRGSSAGGPGIGVVVVWRHHVGIITGKQNGQWVVKSGNDGRRVRERPRSVAGAIAFRRMS